MAKKVDQNAEEVLLNGREHLNECPYCEKRIIVKIHVNGECPYCDKEYNWDSYDNIDYFLVKE